MPTLAYLAIRKEPMLTAEWQAWVIVGVVIIGIIALIIGFKKSKNL